MSVTEPSLPTNPLYWWSDADLNRVNQCLSQVIQTWFDEWGDGGGLSLQCQVQPASVWSKGKSLDQDWQAWEMGTKCFWLESSSTLNIFSMLFGNFGDQHQSDRGLDGEISSQLIAKARQALIEHLNKALLKDGAKSGRVTDACLFERWSGALAICLSIAGNDLRLLLNTDLVKELVDYSGSKGPKQSASLQNLAQAIGHYKVGLRVELKPVDIDLGTLASLQIGDILSLAHDLKDPVQLKDSYAQVVGEGYLGRIGDAKAIQLKK